MTSSTSSSSQVTAAMLDRYLARQANATEQALVTAWLSRHPVRSGIIEVLRNPDAEDPLPDFNVTALPARIEIATRREPATRTNRISNRPWLGWIGGAAVASALLGWLLLRDVRGGKVDNPSSSMTYTTATGQRATIQLRDGSQVTLAPQSTLRVVFGEKVRAFTLDGEAYFDVTASPDAPFTVRSGKTMTRVLGTGFNIRGYAADALVHVAVTEGKVLVTSDADGIAPLTLSAGDIAVATDSALVRGASVDAPDYTSWMGERLVFRDARVSDVLRALTRWYGYDFHLLDTTLNRQRLTIGVSTQSSQAALETLKRTLDVDLIQRGNHITLRARRAGKTHVPIKDTRREPVDHIPMEVGR